MNNHYWTAIGDILHRLALITAHIKDATYHPHHLKCIWTRCWYDQNENVEYGHTDRRLTTYISCYFLFSYDQLITALDGYDIEVMMRKLVDAYGVNGLEIN